MAQVLDVGLAGGVAQDSDPLSSDGGGDGVFGAGDAGFVQKHVRAAQAGRGQMKLLVKTAGRTEFTQREKVGVYATASDDIATGRRQMDFATAGQKRCGEQDRGADFLAKLGVQGRSLYGFGAQVKRMWVMFVPCGFCTDGTNQIDERLDIANARDVVQRDFAWTQQRRRHDGQGRVLVSCRPDGAVQFVSSLDDVLGRCQMGLQRFARMSVLRFCGPPPFVRLGNEVNPPQKEKTRASGKDAVA